MQSKSADRQWGIWCRDMYIPADFATRDWKETGFRFEGRRRTRTQYCALHWTGGESPPGTVFTALETHAVYKDVQGETKKVPEPLSIHFVVDQTGVVYQMADTELVCMHAASPGGFVNAHSIGIEFISRGSDLTKPSKGWTRPRVVEVIHGVKVPYDEMLPAQVRAGVQLVETLCKLYRLPMVVPELPDGTVRLSRHPAIEGFRGVIGHLHVPGTTKTDPGAGLLRAIQARGREMAALPVA